MLGLQLLVKSTRTPCLGRALKKRKIEGIKVNGREGRRGKFPGSLKVGSKDGIFGLELSVPHEIMRMT